MPTRNVVLTDQQALRDAARFGIEGFAEGRFSSYSSGEALAAHLADITKGALTGFSAPGQDCS